MKSIKLNDMYTLYEDGTMIKYNGKTASPTIHKTKNYIEYEFYIKINGKSHRPKLHKLMMAHFGLSKQDCIDKGFLYHYDDETYQSLKKGDNAKNKKLSQDEINERRDDWCYRFINNCDIVYNPKRRDEKTQHIGRYAEFNPLFVPYVPFINRYNEMKNKMLRNEELTRYYLHYINTHEIDMCKFGLKDYFKHCSYYNIDVLEEYQEQYNQYLIDEERKQREYEEWKRAREEEERQKQIELEMNLQKAREDEQFQRCNEGIRICSKYVETLEQLIDLALKNDFILDCDVEYIMNNEILLSRLEQYNLISLNRNERAIGHYCDIKSYSDEVDKYFRREAKYLEWKELQVDMSAYQINHYGQY